MHTYSAYVKAPSGSGTSTVIRTEVRALDVNSATFLLRAQYGSNNLVSIPKQEK